MKKFVTWLVSIAVCLFVADRILALGCDWIYSKSQSTDTYKVNECVRNTKAEVLFMGSSRCHHDYVPSILQDSLGMSVFNCGLWGMRNIYYQWGMLNLILDRYTPKMICYEVHPIDILATPYSGKERINSLSPFIGQNDVVDSMFRDAGTYYYYQLSHLYRYNGGLVNDILGATFVENSQKDGGYKPLYKHIQKGEMTDVFDFPIDNDRLKLFNRFVSLCKSKGIKFVLFTAPTYNRDKTLYKFNSLVKKIAQEQGIDFIDNTELTPIYNDPDCFADRGHLNDHGAKKYSQIVGGQLKKVKR